MNATTKQIATEVIREYSENYLHHHSLGEKLRIVRTVLSGGSAQDAICDFPQTTLSLRESVVIANAFIDNGEIPLSREQTMTILLRCRIKDANHHS